MLTIINVTITYTFLMILMEFTALFYKISKFLCIYLKTADNVFSSVKKFLRN